jgi:hypothetical protein
VVNSRGKQDLNRSPQEDKCLVGTENDRWRCIGKVLQAISLKVFIFFCLLQRGHFPFGLDTFDNLYLDLPIWALKYT